MKYKLGEYVKVEFIGRITGAYLDNFGNPIYEIEKPLFLTNDFPVSSQNSTYARRVKEEMMFPLPQEEK